jgi:hypothetical protein
VQLDARTWYGVAGYRDLNPQSGLLELKVGVIYGLHSSCLCQERRTAVVNRRQSIFLPDGRNQECLGQSHIMARCFLSV